MILTPAEEPVVRRAIQAYHEARKKSAKGQFKGVTADQILEELLPTPVRWAELASFIIEMAEGRALPEPSDADASEGPSDK